MDKKPESMGDQEAAPPRSRLGSEASSTLPQQDATEDAPMTPTRNDSSGTTTPVPSPKLESPSSYLSTPMPSRSENDIPENGDDDKEATMCPKWSEVLKTPSRGAKFSPARELNKPGSLHGLGLMVATDRAKKLSQTGRRCATLLFDIAALHDNFAQALLKASLQAGSSSSPASKTVFAVNRSRISFAKQMQGLAICVRGSIARPLQGTMASLGDTAPSIYQRYAATRVNCANARQAALRMRLKYVKAVRDAEVAIQEMRQAKEQRQQQEGGGERGEAVRVESMDTSGQKPWEIKLRRYGSKFNVSPDRLIAQLKEVQSLETTYKNLVEEENQAISQAVTMETMALEAVQKLEEERLQFFVESMNRMLTAEKGALDNMVLSVVHDALEETKEELTPEKKAALNNDFFKNLLKTNSQAYEEGVGLMEAETLGLPEDIGQLRDDVKTSIAARGSRAQVVKALASFLEEVAVAASVLASGLETRIGQEGFNEKIKNRSADPLASVMRRNEGPFVADYFEATIGSVDDTASSARKLAQDLRALCQEKLDPFLLRAEKDSKTASEGDDHRWKHLCETARNETKAQMRYQQANAQFEKARERVKSVDSDKAANGERASKTNKMKPGMSKALGNVFSILPDGGEGMQKMLNADARRAIAQTTFEEADQRENKEKQALDSATLAKAQSLKSYSATAQNLVYTFRKEEDAGWSDIEATLKSLLSSLEGFRSERHRSIALSTNAAADSGAQVSDMAEWTARARNHIRKKAEKADETSPGINMQRGFALKVELEESKNVYKLLNLVETERGDSDIGEAESGDSDIREAERGDSDIGDGSPALTSDEQISSLKSNDLLDSPLDNGSGSTVMEAHSSTTKELLSIPRERTASETSENSFRGPRSQGTSSDSAETELFLAHFFTDLGEDEAAPTVIESFSCAYWPKEGEGYLSPLLHGRLFVTSRTMYFVGWGGKKIVLNLEDVVTVSKEKNLMGTIDNSLKIVYNDEDEESSYFFGSFAFRDNAFLLLQQLSTVARSLRELNGSPAKSMNKALPEVPPDQVIKNMEIVVSKKIKNVSIQRFYEIVWSEGEASAEGAKPFFGPWLEEMGSRKVKMGNWEFADNESDHFVNKWCGQKYAQKRSVSYEFTRTTHLYVGPPIAGVRQTHHCIVNGNDKCVVAMTVEMEGIPYADCFAVEVRWVARRVGAQDIQVDVGVLVDFKKSTMFSKQIRSGTITETKPIHLNLFEKARAACHAAAGQDVSELEEGEEAEEEDELEIESEPPKKPLLAVIAGWKEVLIGDLSNNKKLRLLTVLVGFLLVRFISSRFRRRVVQETAQVDDVAALSLRMDDLQNEMREIHKTLEAILEVLKRTDGA